MYEAWVFWRICGSFQWVFLNMGMVYGFSSCPPKNTHVDGLAPTARKGRSGFDSKNMFLRSKDDLLWIPRTQMTLVLLEKSLVLEGWPSKIEVIWALGLHCGCAVTSKSSLTTNLQYLDWLALLTILIPAWVEALLPALGAHLLSLHGTWMEDCHFARPAGFFWGGELFGATSKKSSKEVVSQQQSKKREIHYLPAPSKGCQLNPKGWWIDTLQRNNLAPLWRCW